MVWLAGYGVVIRVAVVRRRATRQRLLYLVLMDVVTGEQARMLAVEMVSLVEPLVAVELEGLGLTMLQVERAAQAQTAQLEFIRGR